MWPFGRTVSLQEAEDSFEDPDEDVRGEDEKSEQETEEQEGEKQESIGEQGEEGEDQEGEDAFHANRMRAAEAHRVSLGVWWSGGMVTCREMKRWILRHPLHRLRCVRVELWRDEGGSWTATLPEWDGATTGGHGQRDTLRMAGDLLRALIVWSLEEGRPIPLTASQLRRVGGTLAGMGLWLDEGEEVREARALRAIVKEERGKPTLPWREWLEKYGGEALEDAADLAEAKRREESGRWVSLEEFRRKHPLD